MAFLDDLKQKIKQLQQKGYLPNFSDNTSFSYTLTQNQSPNVFTPLSQTIQNIQQQTSPYTKQLPQDVYTTMKGIGDYLVNTYAPAIPSTIQKIKQGKNPIQAYKETWQESEEADKQKEAKIDEILKKEQQQGASLWEQSKIASQKPSFQRAMNFVMGFSTPLQPVSPEEADLMIANATKLTREDLQKITAGGEVSPEKLEAYKILTRNPETAQRLKDIATNKKIPLTDKILDYIKDLFTPSQTNDLTPSRVVGELPGEVEKNPISSKQLISEETGIKEVKPEIKSEVKTETKITPAVLRQKAGEVLKAEAQPAIQPTVPQTILPEIPPTTSPTPPKTLLETPSESFPTKKTSIKSPEDVTEIKTELEKIKSNNESTQYGEVLRTYIAGERDVRIAEANQLREQLQKILTPREQEALTFYRDFKGNETELANLLNDPAFDRYKQVINLALHPTDAMLKADEAITQYYHKTLDEGQKLGFLDSTISDEKYITHLLAPSGEEPYHTGIKKAPISRTTPFAKTRTYDTVADAIKAGVKVKTINALDALTIYGQKHAIAASTKLFVNQLKDSALAKWGFSGSDNIPSDWVPLDPSNKYFRNIIPFINSEGKPSFAYQDLYVPKKIAEAIKPLIETNFTGAIPGFSKTKLYQSYLKAAQLGLSVFHMRALNITALNNEGLTGLVKSYAKDISSPDFLENEKDFIRHGGQTSILGKTIEAYKGLQDTSVPSRADILKHIPLIKQVDSFAKELSKVTFDIMQRKFKTQDYALKVSQWIAQHPNASKIELDAAKRSIAKEINAVYGGLNWEALGWSQNAVNIARFLMLAPDWTFSNFFNAKYAFEGGPGGTAARKFWIRSILTGAILTYLTSTLINRKAPKVRFHNFTNVYLGKDKYGKDIFQNLFFAGAPQDVINLINNIADFGVIEGFAQSLAAKASPFIRTGIQALTNRNYLGQEIVPRGMGPIAGTARAAYVYGSNILPIPLSLSTIAQMFLDPKKQYTMPEYILSLMGTRPRHLVPPGMREITSGKRKGQLVPATPKVEQPLWEQITTGKQYEPIKRRKTIY
jgi:hypothetical protein